MDKYVALGVKHEDLEESIAALQVLKPVMQKNIILGNSKIGSNKEQTVTDVKEFTKHIDTAIK